MSSKRLSRRSGVLLPVTALPGKYGIGDCGPTAYQFIDWLKKSGQRYWHILPLSIPDITGSPYASLSSAAGNWLMISPETLLAQKLLPPDWHGGIIRQSSVPYRQVFQTKWQMIRASFTYFQAHTTSQSRQQFEQFQKSQKFWLDDYVLFQALKDRHQQQPWWSWTAEWRNPVTARQHLDQHLIKQMQLHAYAQWLWTIQWDALKMYANKNKVEIIGDMPFFVRHDSVDVWSHPNLFIMKSNGKLPVVAGVPADTFSKDGQRWGNPLYNWPAHQRQNFRWWIERFRLLHSRVDVIRFDHFRGLLHTWHIPFASPTAREGKWVSSPGRKLLRAVKGHVPHLNLIAEDLGPEGPGGDELRRAFHAPTIRLLVFGWNGLPRNPHAPQTVGEDVVYYTTNHDTNTTVGWWKDEAKGYERKHLRERVGKVNEVAWQSIDVALLSRARIVISSMQDILGLGSSGRFNRPGRQRGNWAWRLRDGQMTSLVAKKLKTRTANAKR